MTAFGRRDRAGRGDLGAEEAEVATPARSRART
jgi:hypothetical protein